MSYLLVAAGLILLLAGAEFMVRGAVALARRLGVSLMLIGLTIVAYGTTAPEFVVSLEAALAGLPGIAVGTVVGTNIANILLILGTAGLITPILCRPGALRRDGAILVGASLLFVGFAWYGAIAAWQGALMVAILFAVTGICYWTERREGAAAAHAHEAEEVHHLPRTYGLTLVFLIGGLAGVILGSRLLLEGAVSVARTLGVSEAVIGLTLIAVGTSLPELATAVVAAYRRHPELALGNVLGANMFNILGVMGTVSLVTRLQVPTKIVDFDLWVMLGVTMFFVAWMIFTRRLGRPLALVFLAVYGAYVAVQYLAMPGAAAS
jgi:cation:H+ antiporter